MRNFDEWLSTFKESINGYGYYTDFDKVYENAAKYKTEIFLLNSLVVSKNIEADFEQLLRKYPQVLKAIPILLAVREKEIYCQDSNGEIIYHFDQAEQSVAQYKYFMRATGLFDLLENHVIRNLYDYVTGVEVGLDSNGRKNRGGHQMEKLVECYLTKAGLNVVNYSLVRKKRSKKKQFFPILAKEAYKEMYLREIEERWNMDLSSISAEGTSEKRWDFVVKTESGIYVIETNFYASNGSKLNETARSYKKIAEEAAVIPDFCFVWITDGGGWRTTRGNLEETFKILPTLYNINDMKNGIFQRLFSR